jgi:hypothetical protein
VVVVFSRCCWVVWAGVDGPASVRGIGCGVVQLCVVFVRRSVCVTGWCAAAGRVAVVGVWFVRSGGSVASRGWLLWPVAVTVISTVVTLPGLVLMVCVMAWGVCVPCGWRSLAISGVSVFFAMVVVCWWCVSSLAPDRGVSEYRGVLDRLVGVLSCFMIGVSGSGGPHGGDGGREVSLCGCVGGGVLVWLGVSSVCPGCAGGVSAGDGGGRCSRVRCVASCCSWLMLLSSRYKPSFVM